MNHDEAHDPQVDERLTDDGTTDDATTADGTTDEPVLAFLDEHRQMINACLDGITEQQARFRLVASTTTLLGLVKHATFVERVWFEEAVTGQSRDELGLVAGPDESFVLDDADTIASVRVEYREACGRSRAAVAARGLDAVVTGNRRGPLSLRWIVTHVLRETAQHCGHADILREQLLRPLERSSDG